MAESIFKKKLQEKIDSLEKEKLKPSISEERLKEIDTQLKLYEEMMEK